MTLHLLCILVVETEDEHGQAVAAGEVDGLEQLTSYAWQTEVNKVAVGVLKVSDECRYVHLLHHFADASMGRVFHIVDYGQERADVHSGTAASGANSLVAKAKLNAKAANNLQHAIVITDDIAHRVCVMVFLSHLCIYYLTISLIL